MPDIRITPWALAKINAFATEAHAIRGSEIGGMARIRHEDDAVIVTDAHFLPQRATAGYFEIDADEMHKWVLGMVQDGRGAEIPEWCSIVHSHPPGMSAHMSGTDVSQLEEHAAEQDGYSLILPAARKGGFTTVDKLLMHYAVSSRVGHLISRDLKLRLHVTYDEDRMLAIAEALREQLGLSAEAAINKATEVVVNAGTSIDAESWGRLQAMAKRLVPELIPEPARHYGMPYTRPAGYVPHGGNLVLAGDNNNDEDDDTIKVGDLVFLRQESAAYYSHMMDEWDIEHGLNQGWRVQRVAGDDAVIVDSYKVSTDDLEHINLTVNETNERQHEQSIIHQAESDS